MSVDGSISERVLPHDLEAERACLGAIVVDNAAWPPVAGILVATDFMRDAHRRMFAAMARLREIGSAVDLVLLSNELRRTGELEECGGPAYLAAIVDGVPHTANAEHYALVVREKSRLRAVICSANQVLASAYAAETPVADLVEAGVTSLLALTDAEAAGVIPITAALREYVDAVTDETSEAVIPLGLTDVDEMIGGFGRKKLTIIAARPSVGKSSLALYAADHAAASGVPAAIITLEMEPSALAGNLLASHSGVSSDRLRRKVVSDRDWDKIGSALKALQDRPLYLVTQATTLTQIAAWARRLRETYGVRLLFLDYLQLLGAPDTRDRQQEVARLSRGLKRLAVDEDIAMVALSQLSRESEKRQDKRPHLSDLRESGGLEQDADLVLLLFREELYQRRPENEGIAEVIVAKNRSGPVGTTKVVFLADLVRWGNLALGGMG